LRARISELGSPLGLSLEGFDRMVDWLVGLHAVKEARTDHRVEGDLSSGVDSLRGPEAFEAVNSPRGPEALDSSLGPEALEVVEIDSLLEFHRLADGRDFLQLQDLLRMDYVRGLLESGLLTEEGLRKMMEGGPQKLDIDDFEALLDQLVIATGQYDEDSDDRYEDEDEEDDEDEERDEDLRR